LISGQETPSFPRFFPAATSADTVWKGGASGSERLGLLGARWQAQIIRAPPRRNTCLRAILFRPPASSCIRSDDLAMPRGGVPVVEGVWTIGHWRPIHRLTGTLVMRRAMPFAPAERHQVDRRGRPLPLGPASTQLKLPDGRQLLSIWWVSGYERLTAR
jgi:hypothetical protein